MTPSRVPIQVFFALFTISGFAGLIYESIWSHYLKLFLGHAAYAQTLVLAIFMGGMAIGSWLVSRFTLRIANLLLGYALAELGIGILAIAFHTVFVATTGWALESVFPALGGGSAVDAIKWTLAALLILPASLLLGTTFPLMSAGVIRLYPEAGGHALSMLYFTNSLGAAIGVLASGFFLIAQFGLPGTILTAGILNILLAIILWALTKSLPRVLPPTPDIAQDARAASPIVRCILILAFVTGAASFIYEITWIRMLTTGLGSSTHSFEVMLSAFILGMSLGSLVLRGRIERIRDDIAWLAAIVFAKAALAVYAVWVFGDVLELIRWVMEATARTDAGYGLLVSSGMIASMIVMFPTAFCAGMTLPLATHALARRGMGESSIGRLYAANTAGCIIGAGFATHVGMELFGVRNLTGFGALVDVSAAILIVVIGTAGVAQKRYVTAAVAAIAVGAIGFFSTQLDLLRMSSGVFRFGQFEDPKEVSVIFYRDGKTASISVTQNAQNKLRSIRTNGKTDAALTFGDHVFAAPDEATMTLAGAIPLAVKPDSALVANIGFGSGLTTHSLLGSPTVTSVDTIEIERMVVEGARLFHPRNRRAYEDPRSHIYIDDAKTFLATHGKRYDVIVSEPSNPWVSGVSTLFSREFYAQVRRNLKPDGLLVQWVQSYDLSVDLLATIFKALGSEYEDYAIYRAGLGDLLVIATPKGKVPELSARIFGFPGAKETLAYLGYLDVADLQGLRIASRSAIEPIFAQGKFAMNSDYFPILDQNAPRARFRGDTAAELIEAREEPVPVLAILDTEVRMPLSRISTGTINRPVRADSALAGAEMIGVFLEGRSDRARTLSPQARGEALLARSLLDSCVGSEHEWMAALGRVVGMSSPFLQRDDVAIVFDRVRASRCWRSLSDDLKEHVLLLEAINDRDASAMWRHGSAVLDQRIDPITRKNALHAAVSGALATGHRADARELWLRHSAKLPKAARDEFLSRLLAAHVAER